MIRSLGGLTRCDIRDQLSPRPMVTGYSGDRSAMRGYVQLITIAGLLFPLAGRATALTPFKKAFLQRYVARTDDVEFQRAVRKANCNLCHVKGEKKDVCNPYGDALAALIEGNADERLKAAKKDDRYDDELAKVLAELDRAFDTVEDQVDANGEKYGDRIRAGKLPVPLPPAGN